MTELIKRDDALAIIGPMSNSNSYFASKAAQEAYNYIRALPAIDPAPAKQVTLSEAEAIREAALREALATVQWLKDGFEAGGSPTAGMILKHAMERIEALIGEKK